MVAVAKIGNNGSLDVERTPTSRRSPTRFSSSRVRTFVAGTILNKNTILTAGHCLEDVSDSRMRIKVGNSTFNQGEEHKVQKSFTHPKFTDKDIPDYDIGILKIATPLTFGDGIQPIGGLAAKEPKRRRARPRLWLGPPGSGQVHFH
ncbi:hypothetical protein VHEMI07995 [[Torrubiella] hemipterigena]|uniref:Peptidase S1 domain-containing protein n=1 Tax=[Torrubiella] hemipterigena TaxID=1531966 RepID=A0A0A1TME0_9HYPO|nr:hypothetical protein VHEMI07995 [[Torrubiella] hemipterigena]